ncbi:MAG: toll/interleukin-1 receptor domain-containing protein [Opitutaceae bacterium]|nr:toll/interleukin-1 receptor domain-containing protein [Opitutaceae bacterium]
MLHSAPAAQDFFWDDLLEYIEDRRVIPIVGAELLTVPDASGNDTPLMSVLAMQLAARLRVPAEDCTGDDALHTVVCRYLQRGGRREEIYPRIRTLMKELAPAVPPVLRALARIQHFNLFVSTTFDSLLAQALDEERHGGLPRTQSIAYAPNHTQDLAADARRSETPTVFHLLGRMSASPDYVITEEDTLEFFTSMQSESKRPGVLLDELKSSHLLLLGNSFPDWLTRFFIRIAKSGRLSLQREELEIIADRSSAHDAKLVLFLRNFSYRTQVYEGSATEFVHALSDRYLARNPGVAAAATDGLPSANPGTTEKGSEPHAMKPGSVFISYSRADSAAVETLHAALEAAGIDVWFDQRRLEGGDDFDAQIKKNIRSCSYFVPIISASTQSRHEGYFRLEWDLAVERSRLIAESVPFILPVAIDPVSEAEALVPERFRAVHWTRLPGGEPTPEFVERMVRLIRDHRKRERGLL